MIPNRFLSRQEWEAKLRRWGCQPLDGKGPLNTAEWWQSPSGYPFTVPIEDEAGRCDFWAIRKLAETNGSPPNSGDPDHNLN